MKYKTIKRRNPQNPNEEKWYANPVNAGTMDLDDLSKAIAGRSSLTAGDVYNTLSNCVDEIPTFLKIGMSIKLGNFGTLRLTISSEGANSKEEFTIANINGVRVIFTPSVELKKALKDVHFEEEK
jgi:predicted histone-like DNA-binding protein